MVLNDVTFDVNPGFTGLLGVNGAGKTTVLRLATGQLNPLVGRVTLGGIDPAAGTTRVGYCPQDPSFPRGFTVAEFLGYLAWLRRIPRRERKAAVAEALEWADLVEERRWKLQTLSGGMLRRLAVAQAILGRPQAVFLDEPTTGLDPEQRARVRGLLATLPPSVGVLMSSHLVEDLAFLCERVVILHGGRAQAVLMRAGDRRLEDERPLEDHFLQTVGSSLR